MQTSMLLTIVAAAGAALALTMAAPAGQPSEPSSLAEPPEKAPAYVLDHTITLIDGATKDLSEYKGRVVVFVNVASRCGFTPQYEGLEKLYREHKDDGLVIVGFPANDFKGQEPGTNEEIAEFCKTNYGVTFPLAQKTTVVAGPDQHPLYRELTSQPEPIGGDPKWNFTKFVVDREGRVVARFDADRQYVRTPELEPGLIAKVEELLGQR